MVAEAGLYDGSLRTADDSGTFMARKIMSLALEAQRRGRLDQFLEADLPYIIQAATGKPADPAMIEDFKALCIGVKLCNKQALRVGAKPYDVPATHHEIVRLRGHPYLVADESMPEARAREIAQKELQRAVALEREKVEGGRAYYRIRAI